tara:strand:- start:652 stop:1236 length:585 start_codon:yes stop_codon:yes gene_type:complete
MRWKQDRKAVLSDPKYKNTILYDYLKEKSQEIDMGTLKRVVWRHIKQKNYPVAKKSDLVVHIRLGDKLDGRWGKWSQIFIKQSFDFYNNFFSNCDISGLPISRVVVVTALHFGHNTLINKFHHTQRAEDRSFQILESLERQVKEKNLDFEIVSNNNIDEDFSFMASSTYFVKSLSVNLAKLVVHCLKKEAKVVE